MSRESLAAGLAAEGAAAARAAVARRWKSVDPMLPDPDEPTATCGADLTVTSATGDVAAAGACRHVNLEPGVLELAWSAARQFVLTPWIAGPDVGTALGELIARWRQHLAGEQDAAGTDSAAMIRWPSRDIEGVRALLDHGLHPLTIIALRPAARRSGAAPARPGDKASVVSAGVPDLRIRPAEPGDLEAVERLAMDMMRYDAHFGAVRVHPDTAGAVRESAARLLAAADPWLWLAEREGRAVGLVQAEPPVTADWIAPAVRPRPVGYLGQMSVAPGERGAGIGTALVEHVHRELDATGAAVTLLHYAELNPLSAPFWNRMGYRPLWTLWEVRPAADLRPA